MRRRRSDSSADSHAPAGLPVPGRGGDFAARAKTLRAQLDASGSAARRLYTPDLRAAVVDLIGAAPAGVHRRAALAALGITTNVYAWSEWRAVRRLRSPNGNGGAQAVAVVAAARALRRIEPVDVVVGGGGTIPGAVYTSDLANGGGIVLTTPSGCVVSRATVAEIAALIRALETGDP
jgi:hypothetical protein